MGLLRVFTVEALGVHLKWVKSDYGQRCVCPFPSVTLCYSNAQVPVGGNWVKDIWELSAYFLTF